jgi:hypothetical protein
MHQFTSPTQYRLSAICNRCILAAEYATRATGSVYPGVAIVVCNFLILVSAIVMRFGRASSQAYSTF